MLQSKIACPSFRPGNWCDSLTHYCYYYHKGKELSWLHLLLQRVLQSHVSAEKSVATAKEIQPPASHNVSDKNLSFGYNYLLCCVGKCCAQRHKNHLQPREADFTLETCAQEYRLMFGRIAIWIYDMTFTM